MAKAAYVETIMRFTMSIAARHNKHCVFLFWFTHRGDGRASCFQCAEDHVMSYSVCCLSRFPILAHVVPYSQRCMAMAVLWFLLYVLHIVATAASHVLQVG